jgi:hypothetical protein
MNNLLLLWFRRERLQLASRHSRTFKGVAFAMPVPHAGPVRMGVLLCGWCLLGAAPTEGFSFLSASPLPGALRPMALLVPHAPAAVLARSSRRGPRTHMQLDPMETAGKLEADAAVKDSV